MNNDVAITTAYGPDDVRNGALASNYYVAAVGNFVNSNINILIQSPPSHEATGQTIDMRTSALPGDAAAEETGNKRFSGDDRSDNSEDRRGTEVDPWDIVVEEDTTVKWSELTTSGKVLRVLWNILRIFLIIVCLYFFICSLDVLQDAFQMLSGRTAGNLFQNSLLINNPVSATMIGVFVTVIVQSSSTSTSIIVSMVAANLLTVEQSIPIIMGANIGTTVTNTFVALTQSMDRDAFRRAFAGATVHDAFNWLSVIILLPLECASHYLFLLTEAMTKNMAPVDTSSSSPQFLKVLTSPLTNLIIQVDKKVITAIAENSDRQKFPLAKYWAKEVTDSYTLNLSIEEGNELHRKVDSMVFTYNVNFREDNSTNTSYLNYTEVLYDNSTKAVHIFVGAGLEGYIGEVVTGVILLIGSLLVMTFCLIFLVKILNSLFKGPMTGIIRKALNADFPGCFSYFTGYVVMFVGVALTVLFQSSSVFTSALTPLVGMGLITVERMYPLTLGSNIGTTVTSMLAAFTADADKIRYTVQIALCHLFFNISGIILFYPIPFTRVPIPIAKMLGNKTAKYRWFAIFYLIIMFVFLPLLVFGLSLAGGIVLMAVGIPLLVLLAVVVVINIIQTKKPHWLPIQLRNWDFLPKPLHSLEPYDRVLSKCSCCRKCNNQNVAEAASAERNSSFVVTVDDTDVTLQKFKQISGLDNQSYFPDSDNVTTNSGNIDKFPHNGVISKTQQGGKQYSNSTQHKTSKSSSQENRGFVDPFAGTDC